MTSIAARCLLCLVFLGLLVPLGAAAQPREHSAEYAEAIRDAVAEFDLKNFPEARERFRRAHGLFPNARTLRGLGLVEFELRNYGESVRFLGEALACTERQLTGELRRETETVLTRAKAYVGEVHFAVEPQGSTVVVDGTTVELEPSGSLILEVGDHVVEVRAPGHHSERRKVQVKGGAREDVHVVLGLVQSDSEATPPRRVSLARPDAPPMREPVYKKWWVWTLAGVAVAGGAITAGVLLSRDPKTRETALSTPSGVAFQTLEMR